MAELVLDGNKIEQPITISYLFIRNSVNFKNTENL